MIRRPELASQRLKRTVSIGHHKTSVSLEAGFWSALKEIAAHEEVLLISALATRLDTDRDHANLSSVIRLFVLDYYRQLAEGKSKR